MPKVLIIGATGYIGKRLASLLVQSGQHQVFGIARNTAKAKSLALEEITPVVCADPINEPAAYLDAIRKHHIDTIVDVAAANQDSAKFLSDVKKIGEERLKHCEEAGIKNGPKLGFIYCSGTWVHGGSEEPVNDLDTVGQGAPSPPSGIVAWRVDLEKSVLAASDVLDVAVLRPALIYGRQGAIWTPFILPLLKAAQAGSTENVYIPLDAESKPGLIHVDDVASGFKAAIEKLSIINGSSTYPVFDLVTTQESMSAVFAGLAKAWSLKGRCKLAGTGGDGFADAMSTTFRGSSARARQLLGWEPTRLGGLVGDIDVYAAAFASQY